MAMRRSVRCLEKQQEICRGPTPLLLQLRRPVAILRLCLRRNLNCEFEYVVVCSDRLTHSKIDFIQKRMMLSTESCMLSCITLSPASEGSAFTKECSRRFFNAQSQPQQSANS
ncbi:MAG: hypothetical protein OCU24_04220 [Candidatus Methanospirare jalkutatii]|nr:hypothetical protein [Candidatus Methanospirare jalkutatii]